MLTSGRWLSFLDEFMLGNAKLDDIDDWVERWHAGINPSASLAEYLGMTAEEYANWLIEPAVLAHICAIRLHMRRARGEVIDAFTDEQIAPSSIN